MRLTPDEARRLMPELTLAMLAPGTFFTTGLAMERCGLVGQCCKRSNACTENNADHDRIYDWHRRVYYAAGAPRKHDDIIAAAFRACRDALAEEH